MSIASKVYQALAAYKPLTRLLHRDRRGCGIYHGRSPDAGSYPILVYSIISDVPALSADGIELERRVTVRLHILTKDGVHLSTKTGHKNPKNSHENLNVRQT